MRDEELEARLKEVLNALGNMEIGAEAKGVVPTRAVGKRARVLEYAVCAFPNWETMDIPKLCTALLSNRFRQSSADQAMQTLVRIPDGNLLLQNMRVFIRETVAIPKRLIIEDDYIDLISIERILTSYNRATIYSSERSLIGYGIRYLESQGWCLNLFKDGTAKLTKVYTGRDDTGVEIRYDTAGNSISYLYYAFLDEYHIGWDTVYDAVVKLSPVKLDTSAAVYAAVKQALKFIKMRDIEKISSSLRNIVGSCVTSLTGKIEPDPALVDFILDRISVYAIVGPTQLKDEVRMVLESDHSSEHNYA